jgi:hypothetical protein
MYRYSSFQEALSAYDIPYPKREITETGFIRWGKNARYFAKKVGEGYIFGNWKTGLSTYWFPINQKANNKYRSF